MLRIASTGDTKRAALAITRIFTYGHIHDKCYICCFHVMLCRFAVKYDSYSYVFGDRIDDLFVSVSQVRLDHQYVVYAT